MNRIALLLPPLLALAACGKAPGTAVPSETHAEPKAATAERGTVRLDPASSGKAWVIVEPVQLGAASDPVRATGRLTTHEDSTWNVGSVTDGRIVHMLAKLGDQIRAGQVIARMHSHDVHEARADHSRAKGELARATSALAIAKRMRDRARTLYELKAGSLEQVERAEAELIAAESAVRTAEVDVIRTETHLVEYLRIAPEGSAQHKPDENLHDEDLVPVISPGSGVLLRRLVTEGSVVAAGQGIAVVSDLSRLRLIANVGEQDLPLIHTGAAARIVRAALPGRVFQGRVSRIGEEMDPETRTAEVWITIDSAGLTLKPEGYANVEIATASKRPGIFISTDAVQEVEGASSVFVETAPNTYSVRAVSLGERSGALVEVKQGLSAGERIAVKGSFLLKSQLLKSTLE
ncbi:MAG: efflux RND transporter periplasmic adaptor subunit [Bryobacterales bacterium]|nr:efflux RND transporter periplasmic adaptor subunit [Bryobacterales bacterium]